MTCQYICGLCTALTGPARKSDSNTVSQHAQLSRKRSQFLEKRQDLIETATGRRETQTYAQVSQ